MQYETTNFIKSLGMEFFTIISMISMLLFATITVKLAHRFKNNKVLEKIGIKLHKYNVTQLVSRVSQIGFFHLTLMAMCAYTQIGKDDFQSFSDCFNIIFAMFFLTFFLTLPLYMMIKIWMNNDKIHETKFQNKYGWIY